MHPLTQIHRDCSVWGGYSRWPSHSHQIAALPSHQHKRQSKGGWGWVERWKPRNWNTTKYKTKHPPYTYRYTPLGILKIPLAAQTTHFLCLSLSLLPPLLSPSISAHPSSSVSWPVFSFYVCIILIIQSNQSILLSFPVAGSPLSCYHSVG